jgi:hypothetical protein
VESEFIPDAKDFTQPKLIIMPSPARAEVFRNDLLLSKDRGGVMLIFF